MDTLYTDVVGTPFCPCPTCAALRLNRASQASQVRQTRHKFAAREREERALARERAAARGLHLVKRGG